MPAYLSHCLQPLNVSCFAPLKQAYGQQVQKSMHLGINYIDKQGFLLLYQSSWKALSAANIKSGFAATGLVPFNPQYMLDMLNIQSKKITPPSSSHGLWVADSSFYCRGAKADATYQEAYWPSFSKPSKSSNWSAGKGMWIYYAWSPHVLAADRRASCC